MLKLIGRTRNPWLTQTRPGREETAVSSDLAPLAVVGVNLSCLKTEERRAALIMMILVLLALAIVLIAWASVTARVSGNLGGPLGSDVILISTVAGLAISSLLVGWWGINRTRQRWNLVQDDLEKQLSRSLEVVSSSSIVCVTDQAGKVLYANKPFLSVFAYTESNLVDLHCTDICSGGLQDECHREIMSALRREKYWSGYQTLVTKVGEAVITKTSVSEIRSACEKSTRHIWVRTDITAIEKASSEKFLIETLDELQDEVYIYEIESLAVRYANKTACERCGWAPNDFDSKRITDSSKSFVESVFREHVKPLITGSAKVVSIEVIHEKGPVEIRTRTYCTPEGTDVFLSVVRDLSDRKRLERARMESISVISHELRTPLTSIKGSLGLVANGLVGEVSQAALDVISIASRNTDTLLTMVNGMLDLEKLHAQGLDCELKPIDLVDVVSDAVTLNQGFGAEHDVEIIFDKPRKRAKSTGSETHLIQLLSNLISNAIKYSPAGGAIEVGIGETPRGWRLYVRDEGPGIPESDRDQVFQSFGQVAASDGVVRKGTGLGLAIAQTIAKHHHGKLDYQSIVGEGAEFFVLLPRNMKESKGVKPAAA